MTSRICGILFLASLALSASAGATCSRASLTGTYGFLGGGTDGAGAPTAILIKATFNPTTGTFAGTGTQSQNGVVVSGNITGKYSVASNCTGTGITTIGGKSTPFSFAVTSGGKGLTEVDGNPGTTSSGFAVAQGSPVCTNAGVKGSFGFQAAGVFLVGAPFTGPVAFVGELMFSVNASGHGVIGGHVAGSENGVIVTFAEAPVTGSYSVNADCTGTAIITPTGHSALHFDFVVVNGGTQALAIETDLHTVVSGTLQR